MSDAITFDCTGCGMPYKVAASYAGREFNCKKCGTRLCVPQPGQQVGEYIDASEVELDSGSEVMRKTDSGRQVKVDPTRVFKRQRETSARMAAVGPQEGQKKSGKGVLIAVVAVLVLAGAGVGAAFALGAFSGNSGSANQGVAAGNTAQAPKEEEESARDKILKQVDVSGQSAAEFMDLFKQAEAAKLDDVDLAMVGKRVVQTMIEGQGAGFSDADLMAFAERMKALHVPGDADGLYRLVVSRNRGKSQKSEQYAQAHKQLGDTLLDFDKQVTRATELKDSGVIEGADKLYDELLEMESRADEGWAVLADKNRFEELTKELDAGEIELERIKKEDPFRITVAEADARFRLEKVSTQGEWHTVVQQPYIFFVQEQGTETEAEIRTRMESALLAASQFPTFFQDTLVKPLKLNRALPAELSQQERDAAPFEVLVFRSKSYWSAYLRSHTDDPNTVSEGTDFIEPGTGRTSIVYEEEKDSLGKFLTMLVDSGLYNFHPDAPKTPEEAKTFVPLHSYVLGECLIKALWASSRSRTTGEYKFFFVPDSIQTLLQRLQLPYEVASNGKINSFGGPAFTARQIVSFTKWEDAKPVLRANLESYEGWDETYLAIITNDSNTRSLMQNYMHALIVFAYYYESNGSALYRDKLMKFIRMDLDGEATGDKQLPAFEKAFELDEAGWKTFEADFVKWQKGE
ncbi:MAG: hypothetical protein KDB82_14670 [Planctomycetes bacterium]|nr:hypothetical protein [Planctomycetota bacterium]